MGGNNRENNQITKSKTTKVSIIRKEKESVLSERYSTTLNERYLLIFGQRYSRANYSETERTAPSQDKVK